MKTISNNNSSNKRLKPKYYGCKYIFILFIWDILKIEINHDLLHRVSFKCNLVIEKIKKSIRPSITSYKWFKWNLISKLGEGSHVAYVFNKTFILLSVTDLGFDFGVDIIENGDNLPITTFRSGYKFTLTH
ncbi:hypothetical protein ACTFIV_007016 [Dictyostelium citrinum]